LPASEVLERTRANPSLDAVVGRRALELAESYGDCLLDQEAERVVNGLYDKLLLPRAVRASHCADKTLSEPIRQRALSVAEQIAGPVSRLNAVSWSVASQPGATPEAYALALEQGEAACEAEPGNGFMLNTRGAAQYRAGHYREAGPP
jgi:hypothetical protein